MAHSTNFSNGCSSSSLSSLPKLFDLFLFILLASFFPLSLSLFLRSFVLLRLPSSTGHLESFSFTDSNRFIHYSFRNVSSQWLSKISHLFHLFHFNILDIHARVESIANFFEIGGEKTSVKRLPHPRLEGRGGVNASVPNGQRSC